MKKDTPEFIKNSKINYIKKISEHCYQHKDGKVIVLVPYKDENVIVVKLKEDLIYSVEFEKLNHKRLLKSEIFMRFRNDNPITSIKKYKRYKDLISKTLIWLQDKEIDINSYLNISSKMKDLREFLN